MGRIPAGAGRWPLSPKAIEGALCGYRQAWFRCEFGFLGSSVLPGSEAFRAVRGSLSCVDKRRSSTAAGWSSNQRSHPCRPVVCATRSRYAIRSGISGRHIHVPSGNVAHRARRPLGIRPSCLPGLNGDLRAGSRSGSGAISCSPFWILDGGYSVPLIRIARFA